MGGAERYLAAVIPALQAAGHTVAFAYETDRPGEREPITSDRASRWCVESLGPDGMVTELHHWQPDALYVNGLLSPALEARLLEIAPAAFFAHGFYGTCISGAKSFKRPVARPCDRHFGWPCLLHYYPHGCGGWNPITMLRDYRQAGRRLALLQSYAAIVTPSRRMETPYEAVAQLGAACSIPSTPGSHRHFRGTG